MNPNLLSQLRLELYDTCPLVCRHCYQGQTRGPDRLAPLFADRQRWLELIKEFVQLGGHSASLSGGEMLITSRWPQVRQVLLDLVSHGVREIRINSALAPSTPELLVDLANLPIEKLHVQAGLDGPSVHDWLRFTGALERTLSACRHLRSLGIARLSLRTTLFFGHRVAGRQLDNLSELEWILSAAGECGARRLKTKVVHPCGTLAEEAVAASEIWRQRSDRLLAPALEGLVRARLTGRSRVRLLLTNPLPASFLPLALAAQEQDPEGVAIETCQCGAQHLAIDGEGNVFRCLFNFGRAELSLGNVFCESLSQIAHRPVRFSYLEDGRQGACAAFEENLRPRSGAS
jgi:MoaA/NifB/PqqE/SkfB family radical SAM enzyme